MHTLTFSSLLYRYLFYGWLFRNADRGSMLERAAAWQHNKSQSRWLPTYIRRWAVIGILLFVVAAFFEAVHAHPLLFTFFYTSSALSVPVNTVTLVAWVLFTYWK